MWDPGNYRTFESWYDTDHWWGCYYGNTGRNVPLESYPYALLFSPGYSSGSNYKEFGQKNYKEFGQNKVCSWDLNLKEPVTSKHELILQFLDFDIEVLK